MKNPEKLRRLLLIAAGAALLPLLVAALQFMSIATRDASDFSGLFLPLLLINCSGLLILLLLIGIHSARLALDFKAGRPGARLTLRIVLMLALVALIPQTVGLWFSLDLLRRGIDSWFNLEVEQQAMEDSLKLSRLSLEMNKRDRLRDTYHLSKNFASLENILIPFKIDEFRERVGAEELTLFSSKGLVLFSSSTAIDRIVPVGLDQEILLQLRHGDSYISLDPLRGVGLQMRVATYLDEAEPGRERRILQALYPVPEEIDRLAVGVEENLRRYRQLSYLRPQLTLVFTLVLILVILVTMCGSAWLAFLGARRLAAPIVELAQGTQAIARGRYDLRLGTSRRPELAFLLNSFNEMTDQLEQARTAERASRAQAQAQHTYLEGVLGCISSGVLVLDQYKQLRASNSSADRLLDAPISPLLGKPLVALGHRHPHLQVLVEILLPLLEHGSEWRHQVETVTRHGRRTLLCSGTALEPSADPSREHVIVIDDITTLLRTQRTAAWSEVARRLAHEIKNPLTPIRLSAERLRHKCLPALPPKQAAFLTRLTDTIIEQVESMQGMVNSFSKYAKAPRLEFKRIELNPIVMETAELYRGMRASLRLDLELAPLPKLYADAHGIRQVLNNLLSNALEACSPERSPHIRISTRFHPAATGAKVELSIRDNCEGVQEKILERAFEPYATSKEKGTGLGLAIVQRIVEEHGGAIHLENNQPPPGATVRVLLPPHPPVKAIMPSPLRPEERS